jgi:hypothetical protein
VESFEGYQFFVAVVANGQPSGSEQVVKPRSVELNAVPPNNGMQLQAKASHPLHTQRLRLFCLQLIPDVRWH